MSNKTKKDTKKDTKKKIKMSGGENVFSASWGLVRNTIDLGESMFDAVKGIMEMPYDMAKAIPPQQRRTEPAQVNTPPPKKMPKFN